MSKKLIDLTALTTPATGDYLVVHDVSAGSTKKLTLGDTMQTATAIPNNTITAPMLSTSAITLGYVQIVNSFATASTPAFVQVTSGASLTLNVTIPAGGRRIRITAFTVFMSSDGTGKYSTLGLFDGSVASGTQISQADIFTTNANTGSTCTITAIVTPSAGSKTYSLGMRANGGATSTLNAGAAFPAYLLVEGI